MHNRLYIFSFNPLTFFPFPTKAAIIAFAVCSSVFLCIQIFYIDYIKTIKNDRISQRIHILNSAKDPKLVFWGSSRFNSCIDEKTFAGELGLDVEQVVNLSWAAWEPWQYLVCLRNSDTKIGTNTIAIIEINPWTFNKIPWDPIFHEPRLPVEFPIWANSWERLNYPYPDPEDRFDMVLGCFKPMALRAPFYTWVSRFWLGRFKGEWIGKIPKAPYHEDREKEISLANNPNFKAENISRNVMKDYQFCEYKKQVFGKLLSLLYQKGYRIVIVHPPIRREFYNYVSQSPECLLEYNKHKEFLKYLAKNYLCIIWNTPEEMALTSSIFVDYGHFSRDGCVTFSKKLGVELKKLFQE